MKIAHFTDNFYPEMSGISDSIAITSKELGRMGHEIMICAPKYSRRNYDISRLLPREINLGDNVRFCRFSSLPYPGPTSQSRLVIPSFWRWLKTKKFDPDIIHAHLFFGAGIEALLAAKILGKPLLGTSHTPITEFTGNGPLAGFLRKLGPAYTAWYYNRCRFVSAPSRSIIDEMRANGFRVSSRVISNPIPTELYNDHCPEDRHVLKKKFGLSARTVVYTGRLAPEKHIDVIIRAIALARTRLPDITLALTGHGSAARDLKKLAAELKIAGSVKFLGYIETAEMARLYHAAEIFAVASTAETQCMSMINAMASGLPVIGVRARALPEYINENNGLIVPPHDHAAMAEKIMILFDHPEKRKALGHNAALFARKFSTSAIAREWEGVYKKFVQPRI